MLFLKTKTKKKKTELLWHVENYDRYKAYTDEDRDMVPNLKELSV